jgi:hypothetical protein
MEYLRQTVGSAVLNNIFNLPPALRNRMVEVIIIPAENMENIKEKINYKCNMGFLDIPPLPDSFFDPLPEEDLQAWGL